MKTNTEKRYYAWLAELIKQKKKGSVFFTAASGESYDLDILMILNHVQKHNPHLIDAVISDAVEVNNTTRKKIIESLSKSEKGASVKWKDRDGKEIIFVNAGEDSDKGNKRIIIFSNNAKNKDISLLKANIFKSILQKDIEYIYNKTAKQRRPTKSLEKTFFKETSPEFTNGTFEKMFKELVREQGLSANPNGIAGAMIRTMPETNRKIVFDSIIARKLTVSQWEAQLSAWKAEALNLNPERTLKRSRSLSQSAEGGR